MADLKISQLPTASSLANTDLLPIKTTAGTKAITFENLKKSQEGYFQKEGTVIWEDSAGATHINIALNSNRIFDIYVAANELGTTQKIIRIKTIIATYEVNIPFPYYLEAPDFTPTLYTIYIGMGTIISPNDIKIYKIIEYEV